MKDAECIKFNDIYFWCKSRSLSKYTSGYQSNKSRPQAPLRTMGNSKSRPQLQIPTEHSNTQSPAAHPEPQTQEEQSDTACTIMVTGMSEALLEDLEMFFRHFEPMCSYLESRRESVFAQLLENHRLRLKAPPECSMRTVYKDVFPFFRRWQRRWFEFKLRMDLPQETSKFKFEYREGECELLYLQGIILIGRLEDMLDVVARIMKIITRS